MVIQRIQTLYMILGIGLLVTFLFIPFGYENLVDATGATTLAPIKPLRWFGYFIPVCCNVLLLLVAIFMFRRPGLQKGLVLIGAILTLAMIVMVVYVLVAGAIDVNPAVTVTSTVWGGGGLLLAAAFIAEVAAIAGIDRDRRILRSYDRLR